MTAALQLQPRERFCLDCGHIHGGKGYGLCFERSGASLCPCITANALPRKLRPVSRRTLVRRAAKAFAELTAAERAEYDRWAHRWVESDLTMHEFAVEAGLDEKLLWRAWKASGLPWGGFGSWAQ